MMKVLIVDDENLIRYSLSATLRDARTAVRTVANGREALEAVRAEDFDMCFLDLHLPDMSGIDIMKVLKAERPRTRIIVMSGERLAGEMKTLVEENAVLFLEKPFDLEQAKSIADLIGKIDSGATDCRGGRDAGSAAAERRRHARRASDKLVLYTAVAPGGEAKAINLGASLRDVSDSGMRICAGHALEPGCRVSLSDGSMFNEGVVRWSKAARKDGIYHIGLQFTAAPR